MFEATPWMVEQFTNRENRSHVIARPTISLFISGIKRYSRPGYSLSDPGAFMVINPLGVEVSILADDTRESWMIQVRTEEIRSADNPACAEILFDGNWIRIPALIRIADADIHGLRREFQMIREAFESQLPRHRLRTVIGFTRLLGWLVDYAGTPKQSPATVLKKRIDANPGSTLSLERLSQECGMSSDHLRILFRKEFDINPVQYRNRRRIAYALVLMQGSGGNLQEVADACGYCHVAHFSRNFKKIMGMTPSAYMRLGDAAQS